MFEMLTSRSNRDNSDIEGFGYRSDTTEPDITHGTWSLPGVGEGSHQTVGFKLLSGLLNQSKMLPLKYIGNLTVELELVNHKDDPFVSNYDAVLLEAICSSEWSIENVQLKCDIVNIDNTLQNNYDSHLLNGGKLPISYNTYICQSQAVSGQDISVNVSRAISRLKSVFVSFYKSEYKDAAGVVEVNPMTTAIRKEWLDFVHPMENAGNAAGINLKYDKGYELEFQMQIGSKLFPEYPIRSLSEAFSQLKKSVGILGSNFHSVSISPTQYRNDHFVIGCDTEKATSVGWTGINTRAGDLLSVRVKAMDKAILTADLMPDQMFIVLHSDCMLEISDSGTAVFD